MGFIYTRKNRGASLIELLLTGGMGAALLLSYGVAVSKQIKIQHLLAQKVLAEAYAEQLNEVFRSMKPDEMRAYLATIVQVGLPQAGLPASRTLSRISTGYRLGAPINSTAPSSQHPGPIYVDAIAALPTESNLENGSRQYQVQIVDLSTLTIKHDGEPASTQPASGEVYLVTTSVSFGEDEHIFLATVLPTL